MLNTTNYAISAYHH